MVVDKKNHKAYIRPNNLKGSTGMYLFATKNSYNSKQAMQNNGHGLIGVCEYFSYEEK